jgi:hypothetical protein
LDHKSDAAVRGEKQMFTNAVKPPFQRGAIASPGQTAQTFLFASPYRPTNVYGVGIDDEKGGFPSPLKVISDFESF